MTESAGAPARPDLALAASLLTSWAVLLLWHWPVAALILAQGWRNIDPSALEMAHLDAGAARIGHAPGHGRAAREGDAQAGALAAALQAHRQGLTARVVDV